MTPRMRPDPGISGKSAIVTGGSRGIGRAIALLLAEEGADVTFLYRGNAAAADAVVAEGRAAGHTIAALQVDIRDSKACAAAVEGIAERCGRIDILVNNAGTIRDNPLAAFDDDDVAVVLDTNVTGVFNVTRAVVPYMVSQRAGRIVNISSVAGEKGGRGQTNYAASKGAINAFTRALAVELAPRKINVNCVAPGVIDTDMSKDVREMAGDEVKARILLEALRPAGGSRLRGVVSRFGVRAIRHGSGVRRRRRIQNGMKGVTTMTQAQISNDDILAVLPTVAATIADALGCDLEDVKPDASLIDDLDAESIDFLDMVFRLERAFKVKIPRGKIVENARGTLTEAEFEQNGLVTDVGLAQLRSYLSEVPPERFKTPTKVKDIPRLFTTETFCKLVVAAQRETKAAG